MRKLLPIISFLFLSGFAGAQALQQKLQTAFSRFQQDSQFRYASVSLTVLDAQTGATLFAANPDMGLASASTLKTVTSATAFYMLGPDFQYQTVIGYNGTIVNGTLNGDIIIKGAGDPTLGSWRYESTKEANVLAQIAVAIKKAGIRSIKGRIIGDDSAFGTPTPPDGWIWQDMGNYYGAGTSGLCWRENQYDIKLRTGAINTPIDVLRTVPEMPYLTYKSSELINAPAGTGDRSYAYLPINSNLVYLRGTFGIDQKDKSISVALPDAAFDAAWRLKDTLVKLGISVSDKPASATTIDAGNGVLPAIKTQLVSIPSPTLSKIIYWLNQKSINLYAEQLLKTLAWKAGKTPSTANGVKVLQDFWQQRGIDPNALNVVDGSGLSPGDRITTQAIARILLSAKKESWFSDYYQSLPVYNNMKMKSGSINNVLAYAGYQTQNGHELCFSIMVNNYNGSSRAVKEKMFRLLDVLK